MKHATQYKHARAFQCFMTVLGDTDGTQILIGGPDMATVKSAWGKLAPSISLDKSRVQRAIIVSTTEEDWTINANKDELK